MCKTNIVSSDPYLYYPAGKGVFDSEKIYSFLDLPRHVQKDVRIQFEDVEVELDYDYTSCKFQFKFLAPHETIEFLRDSFGEYGIDEAIVHPDMKELVENIKTKGLQYPPVGNEGAHRTLAFNIMNVHMPYFEIIVPE